ncbi:hypothetical protein B9479_006261 [Cryptococcus floricola]|uniref:Uncharacterized protein n=1 Tax=Cryptococcus floricola TaxID=2591691 RepID=A0A5D3AR48_9TREE|nr:hypothetical protein B9479_006261 [Cryptococcus floricola]
MSTLGSTTLPVPVEVQRAIISDVLIESSGHKPTLGSFARTSQDHLDLIRPQLYGSLKACFILHNMLINTCEDYVDDEVPEEMEAGGRDENREWKTLPADAHQHMADKLTPN